MEVRRTERDDDESPTNADDGVHLLASISAAHGKKMRSSSAEDEVCMCN